MRLGLSTPIVVQVPGVASAWEAAAGPDDLVRVAEAADALGFDHLTCSEHVAVPAAVAAERGGTYWDPLATLSHLAARTERIRLATSVLVLGYHHPLELAKRYGTLDLLSGGRVVLGVGVGSLEAEFDLLGVPFRDRGPRADEALVALRAALSDSRPRHGGPTYPFADVVVSPCAVQDHVPIWVGGRTARSLRRATTYADGWMPFGLGATALAELLAGTDLPQGFELALSPGRPVDPLGDPDGTARRLRALAEVGATVVTCAVRADSTTHYCDQLAALAALAEELP